MIKTFKKYKEADLSCLPCKADKSPLSSKSWFTEFNEIDFKDAKYIGIKGGNFSGGLECLDFDNHQKDATINLTNYLSIPEVKEIYEKYKFPIETTMNGGYHLLFRCDKAGENKKLARRMFNGKPDCIIETKAQNGYFVCSPSPGYKIIRNDITVIEKISFIERAILIDNAISLNEYFKPPQITEYEGTERPGDKYNKEVSLFEIENILKNAGWKPCGNKKWTRPGKKSGISASVDNINGCILLYCFTQNGSPFEYLEAYSPFQIKTLLEFNGDYKACAISLPKPEKLTVITKGKLPESELDKILNQNEVNVNETIEKPPIILSIVEADGTRTKYKRLFTLGNFSVIIGKAKSKKTYLLTLLISYLLKARNLAYKFINDLPADKNLIVWFDTEQGKYDSQVIMKRIIKMSGNKNNLKFYNLRPYTPIERCQIIDYAFKKFGKEIGLCVIDGIADLATAINDELEATRVSSLLLHYTAIYNFHLSIVIHQNKNDNFATGHLGSSLMKKAEVIISTNKITGSWDTEVRCDMIRGVEAFEPFVFGINDEGLPEIQNLTKKAIKSNFYEPKEIDIILSNNRPSNLEFNENQIVPF